MTRLAIEEFRMRDNGERLEFSLRIRNDEDRTLHMIAAPRGYEWDAATRRFTVKLHDTPLDPASRVQVALFVPPTFKELEPGRVTEVSFTVPRVLKTADASGAVVVWPVWNALEVRVAFAVSDTPLYPVVDEARRASGLAAPLQLAAASAAWGERVEISAPARASLETH
ncbi:MAG TPA: hypothetical protein VFQ61_23450 [Polyangiaceae bacterium]|nr:hypothetical protein [Polyangiaceae bacterium]